MIQEPMATRFLPIWLNLRAKDNMEKDTSCGFHRAPKKSIMVALAILTGEFWAASEVA